MKTDNFILVIYGPTGVGKTAFVDMLAESIPAEIVNADMGQFYTPLTIGTAKPNWRLASIPHHLFDIIDKPERFTVVAYREQLKKTMVHIWQKNKIPIVVGGSSFYIKSLFFPPRSAQVVVSEYSSDNLWQDLNRIDPERAKKINPTDEYRLKRALALYAATGKKPSELTPLYDPPADYFLICLTRDRDELYARIDERVKEMMHEGWLDEVKKLVGTSWEQFILDKKIIGYDDIVYYIKDGNSLEKLVATIQQRTRNYAKRQMTFWRMLKKNIENALQDNKNKRCSVQEVNLTCTDVHLYIKQLQNRIKTILA